MSTTTFDVIDRCGNCVTHSLAEWSNALGEWSESVMPELLNGDIAAMSCAFCEEPLDFLFGVCAFVYWDDSWPDPEAFAVHEQCLRTDCLKGSDRHIIWEECTIYRFPSNYRTGSRQPLEQIEVRYTTFESWFKGSNGEKTTVVRKELTILRDPDGCVTYVDLDSTAPNARIFFRGTANEFERGLLEHLGWWP